jgi:hypothetical protein
MKWRYFIYLSPLLLILLLLRGEKTETVHPTPGRSIASVQTKQKTLKVFSSVNQVKREKKAEALPFHLQRVPKNVSETFERDPSLKLSKGFEFVKDIGAISQDKYQPSMGELILKSGALAYFRAGPDHPYIPVAIKTSTDQLFPIAQVVWVKGVTPEMRRQLLAEGHEEYYYREGLKLLVLKTGKNVLSTYSDLSEQGHSVKLEVLKPRPQLH